MSMPPEESRRFDVIHELVTRQLDGTASEADEQQLHDAVTNDAEMRNGYIRYMQELTHITARLVHPKTPNDFSKSSVLAATTTDQPRVTENSPIIATPPNTGAASNPFSSWMITASVLAASVLLIISFAVQSGVRLGEEHDIPFDAGRQLAASDSPKSLDGIEVATLTECINVKWDSKRNAVEELSRVAVGQKLELREGRIKLVFDTGVEALVLAPCLLKLQDRNRVYCTYGRITAKASEGGKGFEIETPVARVTDLGTEFGIAISDTGETEVAVFEGEVDVELGSANQRSLPGRIAKKEHLVQGQATLVDHQGQSRRVFSIDNQRMPGVRDLAPLHHDQPVISAVRDNISERQPESRMFYRIVHAGLREDSRAFIDREHQWNGIAPEGMPRELLGADYVMPFNDDKFVGDLRVQVSIARPSTVYIFFDNNTQPPEWLTSEFVDTGLRIGLDEGANRFKPKKKVAVGPAASIDNTFSIWKRFVDNPQEIELGSFERPTDFKRSYNMYGIAAVARSKP
ncbi:FecR family protein [Aporhodopirellula aestuarii]|uniref:FecR family protein n=1 Tax=Aporhodopirellula aestuarii TaxID=2950107 RepID=A0ABT0U6X6_9BACT|nr:FecR family protein [Aporhodopirellula aestuarii]MCM2372679.1 FecR family protein [Aporhodopirellula aestuarii]